MSSPVIISGAPVGARELLLEEGIDPTPLAQQAGLPPRAFDERDLFVRAAAVVDFMELAAQACRSEAFGLRHARRLLLGILGQGGMIMRAADSVGAARFRPALRAIHRGRHCALRAGTRRRVGVL